MEIKLKASNGWVIAKLMLVSVCFSCNDQSSNLGADFVQNNPFDIGVTDTVTLDVSTVLVDSLITNAPNKLLLGNHMDEGLGTVTATPVFQLNSSSITQLDKNLTSYESVKLTIRTSGYYYYDTISPLSVSVYRVKNEIRVFNKTNLEAPDISKSYTFQSWMGKYNNSRFELESSPLGRLSFKASPLYTTDIIEIPLSDILGRELFGLMQKGDSTVIFRDRFLNFFRGLAIVPDKNQNTCILGLNPSVELRVYYFDKSGSEGKQRYQAFSTASVISFNSILADRSTTILKDLKTLKNPISSLKTGNTAFMQSGTGLGIRVQIPHLKNFLLTDPKFSAASAVLEMSPIQGYNTKTTPIPFLLTGNIVDGQNSIFRNSTYAAPLTDDNENLERNKRYRVDITSFVNRQLLNEVDNDNALLFTISDTDYRNTLTRLAVGDGRSQYQMKLKLYFVTLPKK
jgi:hypothetical protein